MRAALSELRGYRIDVDFEIASRCRSDRDMSRGVNAKEVIPPLTDVVELGCFLRMKCTFFV